MTPDPADLGLPANWDDDFDDEGDGYYVDPGSGAMYPDETIEALQRKIWENAKREGMSINVPDLTAGPYTEDMPWPTMDDFETLERESRNPEFWEFLAANDARSNKYRPLPDRNEHAPALGWKAPVRNTLYTLLAVSVARDMAGAGTWAAKLSTRKFRASTLLSGYRAYHGLENLGHRTKKDTPSVPAVMHSYAGYVASAAPGPILPLDRSRTQALEAPGYTVSAFTTPHDYGHDVVANIKETWRHTSFQGSREAGDEVVAAGSIITALTPLAPTGLFGTPADEKAVTAVHALKVSDSSGALCFYVFVDMFYNTKGMLPGEMFTGALTAAEMEAHNHDSIEVEKARIAQSPIWGRFHKQLEHERIPLVALETLYKS